MKKLIIILIALATLQVTAQEKMKKDRMEAMKDLTPEETATLQTKKMTLHLDLTEAQQKKIYAINLEDAQVRKAKLAERSAMKENSERKPFTKEDKLKMMNERLDHQIAMKQKMKDILNADQFEKWETSMGKMEHRREGKKMAKKKMLKEKDKQ